MNSDNMLKTAIAIDAWKLPIFSRHLTEAGYSFEKAPGISQGGLLLIVMTHSISALGVVVKAANDEAHKSKLH